MALVGSPDYQQLQQSNDVLVNQAVTTVGAVITTLGPFPVAQWLGIACSLATIGVDVQVTMTYFMDDVASIAIAQRTYGISAFNLTPNFWTSPVLGPYMTIGIQTAAGHAPACTLIAAGTQRIGPTFPVANFGGLVEQTGLLVVAGTVSLIDFAYLYAGEVSVSVVTTFATGDSRLQWVDLAGGTHLFAQSTFAAIATGFIFGPVMVPPAHCQIGVRNTTGANGTCNIYVMPNAWRNES